MSRDNVLQETLNQFETVDDINLKGDLKIFFIDEEADDAGGVIREWINLLIDELFDQDKEFFVMKMNGDEPFYEPHGDALAQIMEFTGQILGKALLEGLPISAKLSRLMLWEMLEDEPTLDDLEFYDPQVHKSMKYVMQDDVDPEDLALTFTVLDDGTEVELIEDGSQWTVTKDNRDEYLHLMLKYYSMNRALE